MNTEPQTLTLPTLNDGEHYAGLILNEEGQASHHLILLPGKADEVTWDQAKDFAATAGGDLPTRQEQSLLFANCKQHFECDRYWSSEQHASNASYAWSQDFYYGGQNYGNKSYEGRARAVRRLPI